MKEIKKNYSKFGIRVFQRLRVCFFDTSPFLNESSEGLPDQFLSETPYLSLACRFQRFTAGLLEQYKYHVLAVLSSVVGFVVLRQRLHGKILYCDVRNCHGH